MRSYPRPCPHQPPDARARALDCHCHSPRCLHLLYHFCYVRPPVHVTSIRVGRLVWRERGSSFAPPSLRPGARAHAFAPYCRSPRYLPAPSSTIPALLFASRPRPFLLRVQPYVHPRASCARRAREAPFLQRPALRARLRPILLFTALHAPRLVRVLRELGVSTTTTQPSRAPL